MLFTMFLFGREVLISSKSSYAACSYWAENFLFGLKVLIGRALIGAPPVPVTSIFLIWLKKVSIRASTFSSILYKRLKATFWRYLQYFSRKWHIYSDKKFSSKITEKIMIIPRIIQDFRDLPKYVHFRSFSI